MPAPPHPPSSPASPRGSPRGGASAWSLASGGVQLAAAVLLGAYVGRRLDLRWGTDPWGLVAGAALGFAGGLYVFLKPFLGKEKDR
jgi:F0F1-type ATP synthase assembly protein I